MLRLFNRSHNIDLWLIASTIFLSLFGLLAIYDASVVTAFRDFGDQLYYFKNQVIWLILGLFVLSALSFIDYHKLIKVSGIFLVLSTIVLILVLIPQIGTEVYGARRWIDIGSFTFQPSELAKLAIILYSTSIISKFEHSKINFLDSAIVYFLPIFLVIGLVIIQPDLGTAIIFIAIALTIYFAGGSPLWHYLLFIPTVTAAAVIAIVTQPYRLNRLKSFLDPTFDPQGASYQINQILSAIASGGLLGVGLGASRSKFAFIPEVHSDAIFAIIVEELGFIGAIFLISIILFLVSRAVNIARNAKDNEGKILAIGIISLIAFQSLFNIASVVALVPLTGIPLPFISYGGSSLIVTMASIGILININKQS